MRALLLILCLASVSYALSAPGQGENRMWWADFDLRGPLSELRIDCGEDGRVYLAAHLLAGEERRVSLPLPVRSPLGAEGLDTLPKPHLEYSIEGEADSARFLAWSSEQPERRYQNLGPTLRTRTRPPASAARSAAGPGELALLVATLCLLWALRRSTLWLLALSIFAALGLWVLAGRQPVEGGATEVLEIDGDAPDACLQRAAQGSLELPAHHLEVIPASRPLTFHLDLEGIRVSGTVAAPAATLVGMEVQRAGAWSPDQPPPEPLAMVWFRTAAGTWAPSGPWPGPAAPSPAAPSPAAPSIGAPPGWLATGLPPGRTLLLARSAGDSERWIRISAFRAP